MTFKPLTKRVSINYQGRIVIPIETRKRMGLKEGTEFDFFENENRIMLKKVIEK